VNKSAKIVSIHDFDQLMLRVGRTRQNLRNSAMVLLSFKAGLRACEIAGLDWAMVTTASGSLADYVAISGAIAKNGRARRVPLNPLLGAALKVLSAAAAKPRNGPVIQSQRGGHLTPGSVVNWFTAIYAEVGLQGCSSHSGRRTFITNSARMVAKVGGCLRDVQELAGHSALTTTERYIVGDREAQRKLAHLL
jgi:integrase/recombinase XerD